MFESPQRGKEWRAGREGGGGQLPAHVPLAAQLQLYQVNPLPVVSKYPTGATLPRWLRNCFLSCSIPRLFRFSDYCVPPAALKTRTPLHPQQVPTPISAGGSAPPWPIDPLFAPLWYLFAPRCFSPNPLIPPPAAASVLFHAAATHSGIWGGGITCAAFFLIARRPTPWFTPPVGWSLQPRDLPPLPRKTLISLADPTRRTFHAHLGRLSNEAGFSSKLVSPPHPRPCAAPLSTGWGEWVWPPVRSGPVTSGSVGGFHPSDF